MITGLFIALFSNGWYYIESKTQYESHDYYDYEYSSERVYYFGLSEVEGEYRYEDDDGDVDKDKESADYDDMEGEREADDAEGLFDIATLVFIFTLVGTIIALGFVALGFLAGFRLIPGWIPLIVGIVASFCLMFGPIYMIAATPDAWDEFLGNEFDDEDEPQKGPWDSFWGSDSDSTTNEYSSSSWDNSWGPGWAWYLSFSLGIMMLAAGLLFIGIKRKRRGYGRPRGYYDYEHSPGSAFDPNRVHSGPPPGRDPHGYPEPRSKDAYYDDRTRESYYEERGQKTYPPPPRDDYYRD